MLLTSLVMAVVGAKQKFGRGTKNHEYSWLMQCALIRLLRLIPFLNEIIFLALFQLIETLILITKFFKTV